MREQLEREEIEEVATRARSGSYSEGMTNVGFTGGVGGGRE
jgi:hypothetical protein